MAVVVAASSAGHSGSGAASAPWEHVHRHAPLRGRRPALLSPKTPLCTFFRANHRAVCRFRLDGGMEASVLRLRRRQAVKLSPSRRRQQLSNQSCCTPLIALTGTPCTSPWIRGRSQSRNAFRKERRKTHTKTAPIGSSVRCLSLCTYVLLAYWEKRERGWWSLGP